MFYSALESTDLLNIERTIKGDRVPGVRNDRLSGYFHPLGTDYTRSILWKQFVFNKPNKLAFLNAVFANYDSPDTFVER